MRRLIERLRREQDGASAVPMAMAMTIVLIVAALVIDVGAMSARNAQLQDAADAAALAIAQQCYESPTTNELAGCDPAVRMAAPTTAVDFATATINDGTASIVGAPEFSLHTVTIRLASVQPALFSWAAGSEGSTVGATATAQWNQPAVALPLAIASCGLPDPGPDPAFIGTGVYNGVAQLLQAATSLLSGADLPDYLSNILDCGTNLLAGGWLTDVNGDCTYDPNLLTVVTSTLTKALPINSCTQVVENLIGKRVIVPVYERSTTSLLGAVLGTAEVTRYAEIIVTGYDFEGLLGTGDLENMTSDPGCAQSLSELLGVSLGVVDAVSALLTLLGLDDLLAEVLACQGLQGQLVNDSLTPEEASELLIPYRLIA